MAFYKLLAGKHHEGSRRRVDDIPVNLLRAQLDNLGVAYTQKDGHDKLAEALKAEVGDFLDNRRSYRQGDIIESDQDLTAFNDKRNPNNTKFELVNEHGQALQSATPQNYRPPAPTPPAAIVNDSLSSKTVAELREIAAEEEIDLGSATRKEEILEILRRAAV